MIRSAPIAALAALVALTACSPAKAPAPSAPAEKTEAAPEAPSAAGIAVAARSYEVRRAGEPAVLCMVELLAPQADAPQLKVRAAPACIKGPGLPQATQWAPLGAGPGVRLLGDHSEDFGEFSPVQDGTGVYLRGGLGGAVYELRYAE